MINWLKSIRRFFRKKRSISVNKKRCKKLHIKYVDGVTIGKKVQVWGKTKIVLSKNSRIASNCILWGNGIITIGENSSVGENSWIYSNPNGGVEIGNDVNIAANMYLIDSNHKTSREELIRLQEMESEKVIIGNDVWIGANVTIIKGARIGNGCVVGACSLVNKIFEDYSIIGGVPARKLKERV